MACSASIGGSSLSSYPVRTRSACPYTSRPLARGFPERVPRMRLRPTMEAGEHQDPTYRLRSSMIGGQVARGPVYTSGPGVISGQVSRALV